MIHKIFSKIKTYFFTPLYNRLEVQTEAQIEMCWIAVKREILSQMPESLMRFGFKAYSCGEEDGIIQEIMNRIQPSSKSFVEIGCADGLENNTHFLLLNGWRGVWIDANKKKIDNAADKLGGSQFDRLLLRHSFVTTTNVKELLREASEYFNVASLDFFSLDIDGNDYHVMNSVLQSGLLPSVLCLEYNGKYPPPVSLSVSLDDKFEWQCDDYMGVSLTAWYELLSPAGYSLVTCDVLGNNSFWVKNEYAALFPDYPLALHFQPSRYFLARRKVGHKPTLKFIKSQLTRTEERKVGT